MVACVFVTAVTFLPSRFLATMKGIFAELLPSNDKGIFTEPLSSKDRGDTHTHTHTATWSHKPTLFFLNEESRLKLLSVKNYDVKIRRSQYHLQLYFETFLDIWTFDFNTHMWINDFLLCLIYSRWDLLRNIRFISAVMNTKNIKYFVKIARNAFEKHAFSAGTHVSTPLSTYCHAIFQALNRWLPIAAAAVVLSSTLYSPDTDSVVK
jgi:hypothetical protein